MLSFQHALQTCLILSPQVPQRQHLNITGTIPLASMHQYRIESVAILIPYSVAAILLRKHSTC